jgi:hypothetical protein
MHDILENIKMATKTSTCIFQFAITKKYSGKMNTLFMLLMLQITSLVYGDPKTRGHNPNMGMGGGGLAVC